MNHRFEPQLEFTIPDLAQLEITTNKRLKGPHLLRIVRLDVLHSRDS